MNSRDRILAALSLEEPDRVPFADWIDKEAKAKLMNVMGEASLDDAEFVKRSKKHMEIVSVGGVISISAIPYPTGR